MMIRAVKFLVQFADETVHLKVTRPEPNLVDVFNKEDGEHVLRVSITRADGDEDTYTFEDARGRGLAEPLKVRRGLLKDVATCGARGVNMSLCLSRFRPYTVELHTHQVRYSGKAHDKTRVVVHNVQGKFACELVHTSPGEFEVRVDRLRVCVYHAMLMLLPAICQ